MLANIFIEQLDHLINSKFKMKINKSIKLMLNEFQMY